MSQRSRLRIRRAPMVAGGAGNGRAGKPHTEEKEAALPAAGQATAMATGTLVPPGFRDITDAEDLELSGADRAFLDYVAETAVELYFERLAHKR